MSREALIKSAFWLSAATLFVRCVISQQPHSQFIGWLCLVFAAVILLRRSEG